ncbi:Inner membrane protein translocase component YidC, long form [hydrothermal vent metagenome]|uniref:Membrane protein insertase YidC n=1 Tax=hydrothermal vent metagenome TaxID=652676 RepID=A0A1W1CJL3_9ZZZZ
MEQQQDLQKRLLLALVLSFAVFVLFDMFMPKTTKPIDSNKTVVAEQKTPTTISNQTPKAITTQSTGAVQNIQTTTNAPVTTVKSLTTVTADRFIFSIDEMGRVAQAKLLEDKYLVDGKQLELFNPTWVRPLEIRFADIELNKEALKVPYTTTSNAINLSNNQNSVTLTQKLSTTTVIKKLTFYQDGHYDIDIELTNPVQYFITTGQRPDADHTRYMVVNGSMVRKSNSTTEVLEDGDVDENTPTSFPNAKFASAFDRYYASILYNFKTPLNVSVLRTKEDNALLFVQGEQKLSLHGYIGPKEYKVFQNINPELTEAIGYGWFTFISKPLFSVLQWFHNLVGNWGWAIVLVILLIKLILFPLSYKGMMSMQKLKDLAPQMKEIKEKYGKDPQKMNAKMMEMYKKHGANPMGGCLPMILQIPVFFAIYRVLLNAVELQGAEWILWITDLSLKDPFFVLPILMGISMWYQQRITPNSMTDPMQQKIFQWLPAIMTLFFVSFPAGLVLYWLVNNLLTIVQQFVINSSYEKYKATKAKEHKK